MMNVKTLTAAALLATAPAIASAQDWTGAYIGANLGYTSEEVELSNGAISTEGDLSYITFGVLAGYNVALGNNLIVGGEASLGSPFISGTGKVGYALDSAFVYGLAGFSNFAYGFGPTLGFGAAYEGPNDVIFTGEVRFSGSTDEQFGTEVDINATSILVGLLYQL